MLDDLRALAIFAAIGRAGSFRGAAALLGLSPQSVSHHIAALEARRGVALIHRSTRALRLTAEGERLMTHAAAMSDAAREGHDALAVERAEPEGALRVALSTLFRSPTYLDWIADFAAAHPKVTLSLGFSETRRDLIRGGYDLAIRIGATPDANLKMRKLTEIDRHLVAAPEMAAAWPAPAAPGELDGWPWIMLETASPERVFVHSDGRRAVAMSSGRVMVDNAEAMVGLARAGLGLASAPAHMVAEDLRSGALVEVLPDWRPTPLNVYALWPLNETRQSLAARFVDAMAARAAALRR